MRSQRPDLPDLKSSMCSEATWATSSRRIEPSQSMRVPPFACARCQTSRNISHEEAYTLISALVLSVTSMINSACDSIMCAKILSSTLPDNQMLSEEDDQNEPTRHPNYPSLKRRDTPCPRQGDHRGHQTGTRHCTSHRDQEGTSSSYHHRQSWGRVIKTPCRFEDTVID